ncbi:sensory rhodopsin transducer [Mesorhizobium sp. WSM2239]|uniref:Sensory rhodopsin transducer n=2 Tax=unclassified Mesorhizobium TaxID=325217 RepID=A0AAU8D2V3_9HYPH
MAAIGSRIWAIPEGYIPSAGIAGDSVLASHEAACILNAGYVGAEVRLTLYFSDPRIALLTTLAFAEK